MQEITSYFILSKNYTYPSTLNPEEELTDLITLNDDLIKLLKALCKNNGRQPGVYDMQQYNEEFKLKMFITERFIGA
jgi:hypothetical protein